MRPAVDSLLRESHCTYNVTLNHVRATIVAAKKQYVLHILGLRLEP